MNINLKKFGTTLNGRQFGREALLAFKPSLKGMKKDEEIVVDFAGVITFTPSWGDEFLGFLYREYGDKLRLKNTDNPSVKATLKVLERVYGNSFIVE